MINMEKYYGKSLKVILALGLKMGNFEGKHFKKLLFINLLFSVLTIIQEVKFITDADNNLIEKFTVVPGILNCTLALTKFINSIYYRDRIERVMETMNQLYENIKSKDREAVDIALTKLKKVSNAFGTGYISISLVLCVAPLLKMLQIYLSDGALVLLHPYCCWFPFDWDEYFVSTYLYQCYCGVVSAAQSIIFDVLYTLILSQIVAHFSHVKNSFKQLLEEISETGTSNVEHRNRFGQLIELQLVLHQQCSELNEIFGLTYLTHFLIMSLSICFSGFVIITQPDTFILTTFCVFIAMVLNHTFILCWFGDKIGSEVIKILTVS